MNLLGVAVKLASAVNQPLALDKARCVRSNDRLALCDRCMRACPVGALQTDSPITLNEKICVNCGWCLHDCPTGAFTGEDGTDPLLQFLLQFPQGETIELACSQHDEPELGSSSKANVIQTDRCLAALGPSIYAWLMARGMSQVIVRLDACADCAAGKVRDSMQADLGALEKLFNTAATQRIVVVRASDPGWKDREVKAINDLPVSRRELLRRMTQDAPKTAARALATDPSDPKVKAPPRERQRLLDALARAQVLNREQIVQGLGAIRLGVNEKCSACGACARVCPTGALLFAVTDQKDYRLDVRVGACTDCGVCLDVCEPTALARDRAPSAAEFIAVDPVVLSAGKLKECTRCGAKFAAQIPGDLCSICNFRQQNPFGSRLPPAIAARLQKKRQAAP